MAEPGSPDWWLDRLFRRLRDRIPQIREWNRWYTGAHPAPQGYEDAEELFQRLLETVGLNMLGVVSDATMPRMRIAGFKVDGKTNDDIAEIWQANNFDRGSRLVRTEKQALSEAYVMVDPNKGAPKLTGEHPEQCFVEYVPGSERERIAGIKVWLDDTTSSGPQIKAFLDLGEQGVFTYAAPTRVYADRRSTLALKPAWELQAEGTGRNELGEVSIVPFPNRGRMLDDPVPEWHRALPAQKRLNKSLLDRMAMQDQGAFKAMWATGLKIPRDPVTKEPVEGFVKAVNRMFVNENPDGKYGQLQAEDIKQMLEAVRDDVIDCAVLVPTSADSIMGKLVNVAADGLKLAQSSEVSRTRDRMAEEDDSWEDVNRLALKAAGKSVPNMNRMSTEWRNPEFVTDTEQANAAKVAISAGMPEEVAWERYFNADGDDVKDWAEARQRQLLDPITAAVADQVRRDAADGN
ncbi:phage portal protein [Pimelobacter simplex]|uniref:phage portal protein n=1 Tax=Nocardioides simplex TaxID=2045 RepID=UPI003AAB11A1